MQVVLVMFRGDGERRSFSVVRNMTVIGRREDCDLRIPLGDVSRKHCRLVRTDEGIRIEDLGSSNGTLVNGQRVKEIELNAGDTIGVGPVMFVVQIDGVPAEEELVSPHRAAAEAAVADDDSMAGVPLVAHAPLEEIDDLQGEEYPLDELSLDDAPAEVAHPAAVAHDEVSLDEAPLEELSLEEEPLEEVHPHGAAAPVVSHDAEEMMLDEVPLEEVPLEAKSGPDDRTIDHTPAEAGFEEVGTPPALPSGGGDDLEELDWMEDDTPVAPPLAAAPPPPPLPRSLAPAPPPPPPIPPSMAHAKGDHEEDLEFDLEEATDDAAHEPVPPAAPHGKAPAPAGDGEWDFVVEEADADHSHSDMHINFDESHHGQPHA